MYRSNYVLRTVKVHWMYQKCLYREFFNVHYNNALSEFLFVMLNQKLDFSFFDSFILFIRLFAMPVVAQIIVTFYYATGP